VTLPVREPDEPRRVRLLWDWQQHALLISGRYGMDYIEGREIGLSPELVFDLAEWAGVADAGVNEDYPPDSEQPPGWAEDGFALAKRVRAELPAEWIVTARDPTSGRQFVLPAPMSMADAVSTTDVGDVFLVALLDGEIPLTVIDDLSARAEQDPARRKMVVVEALRLLLAQGLITLGRFDSGGAEEPAWRAWRGPVGVQARRLSSLYTPGDAEQEAWGFRCWIALTSEGKRVAVLRPHP
jgi:hypothetical protein